MKKKSNSLLAIIIYMIVLVTMMACQLALPKNAIIKTQGEYSVRMGNLHFSNDGKHTIALSDFFSVDTIKNLMGDKITSTNDESGVTTSFELYDYNPGGNSGVQAFLADFNIGKNVNIDVEDYFADFGDMLGDQLPGFEQPISVPEFASIEDKEIDFSSFILDAMDLSISEFDFYLPELETENVSLDPLSISISDDDMSFDEMEIYSGKLILAVASVAGGSHTTHSEDFDADLTIDIQHNGASVLKNGAVPVDDFQTKNGQNIEIDLAGSKIYQTGMQLVVSGKTSGGEGITHVVKYQLTPAVQDLTPQKITGLTIDSISDYAFSNYIDVKVDSMFVKCRVATGGITLSAPLPEDWTGVSFTPSISLTGSISADDGDWTVTDETNYLVNRTLNLGDNLETEEEEGKIFESIENKLKINFDGTVSVTCTDATVVLPEGVAPTIKLSTKVDLDDIEYMICDLEAYQDQLVMAIEQDIPSDFASFVKKLNLAPSGFKLIYENNLPAVNEIKLGVDSVFFQMDNVETTIEGCSSDSEVEKKSVIILCEDKIDITPTDNGGIMDITATIELPDASEYGYPRADYPNYAVIKDIGFGKEYNLSIEVEPVFDWHYVVLNDSLINDLEQYSSFDLGLNISSLLSSVTEMLGDGVSNFLKRISIPNIPMYIYIDKPELEVFESIEIGGKICVGQYDSENTYGTEGGDDYTDHIITPDINLDLGVIIANGYTPLEISEDGIVTNLNLGNTDDDQNLSNLFNFDSEDSDKTIGIYYSINFSGSAAEDGIKITKDDYTNLVENGLATTLGVNARIAIPIEIEIAEPEEGSDESIDVMAIIKNLMSQDSSESDEQTDKEKDIFQRDSATDTSQISTFIGMVEEAWIKYNLSNKMFNYTGESDSDKGIDLVVQMPTSYTDSSGQTHEFEWSVENGEFTIPLTKDGVNKFSITSSDVTNMLSIYPLELDMKLCMPEGTMSMPRDAYVDLGLSLGVKTNGEINLQETIGLISVGGSGQ